MEKIVRSGISVIIIKNGKVLLAKRLSHHGYGTWGFPGGHLEYLESFEDCAIREVFEETSLKVKNIRFGSITNDIFESGKHYVTIFMVCGWKSGEARSMEPEKAGEWKWFEWENLPKPLFLPIVNLLKQNLHP